MLSDNDLVLPQPDFLRDFNQNSPQIMWFLGAGTSRSAGMPTAGDIIWDLKRRYYCSRENQDISYNDLNNKAVKEKIQRYLDSQDFPSLWSDEEYGFYFSRVFGDDYAAQQEYLSTVLDEKKISLSIGHRALAALLGMGKSRVVFTTNFDGVIEAAYSTVIGKSLVPFHIEGSYAALDALNSERFPLYVKIHGDFRYKSVKNLPADLLANDEELQRCFLAAADRYGLVVAGYSGRDGNVMEMLEAAVRQGNPFPHGLFWATPRISEASDSVKRFIAGARQKGVRAHLVEVGTFDILLLKIWRQISEKPIKIDEKVRTAKARTVSLPLPPPGYQYPVLRTNALPVKDIPRVCARVDYSAPMTSSDLNASWWEHKPDAIFSYDGRILFWGDASAPSEILCKDNVRSVSAYSFDDPVQEIESSGTMKNFFEHAIAQALCRDKPLRLNRKGRTYYAVVDHEHADSEVLQALKNALSSPGSPGNIAGSVRGLTDVHWAEAISIELEVRNRSLWLLVRPDVWIKPLRMRELAVDFLRTRKRQRYNSQSYHLLDAWVTILLGSVGQGQDARVSCFPESDYPAEFGISTRTAYSRRGGTHVR